jgi:hypothetical protein
MCYNHASSGIVHVYYVHMKLIQCLFLFFAQSADSEHTVQHC